MTQTHRNNWPLLVSYVLFIVCLAIYSYVLIDPNLTLINHPLWESFRNSAVAFGYLNRYDSWHTYVVLVVLGFFFHRHFRSSQYNPLVIAIITAGILTCAYPFLSHDLFNYIFDAHIFTHYGANPYTHIPADFASDPWLRFMHWTHRPYPYGPVFLIISIVASWMAVGKLILNFLLFKGLATLSYLVSVWVLHRMNKKWALFFATQPIVLLEGLVNAHNDIIAVSLALCGVYFLSQKTSSLRTVYARILLLASGGIKFFTLPLLLLQKPQHASRITHLSIAGMILLIVYATLTGSFQQWYALNLFVLIPYAYSYLQKYDVFFASVALSYFPYIRYGEWLGSGIFDLKTGIVVVGIVVQIIYSLYTSARKDSSSQDVSLF